MPKIIIDIDTFKKYSSNNYISIHSFLHKINKEYFIILW